MRRVVEARQGRVLGTGREFRSAQGGEPARSRADAGPSRRQCADRECCDPHAPRRRVPGERAAPRRTLLRARRPSAASCTSRRTAMRRSASSTIPSAGARPATTRRPSVSVRARVRSCTATGRSSRTRFPARPYLGGENLGALDLLAAVVSRWSGTRAHLETARPAFHETLQRIEKHAIVAPVFARHWP